MPTHTRNAWHKYRYVRIQSLLPVHVQFLARSATESTPVSSYAADALDALGVDLVTRDAQWALALDWAWEMSL